MARKATDLLDVFRFSEDEGGDEPQRERARGRGRLPSRKKARQSDKPRRSLQSLVLNRRQIVLAGSAGVLLLVLSFVLGLSTGRTGPSIQRATPPPEAEWIAIQGKLPLLDPQTRRSIEPRRVAEILRRDYGLQPRHLRMYRTDGHLVIEVGAWRSEAEARKYLQDSGLEMLHLYMRDPFRWPVFKPWDG